ncbi:GIY-YIG nuclease family protein [Rhodobacter capsulatus]|uniref:T5orf172 domain-containing protein n=1 Tax=Rhodobacter capsulatus TaxID=1061 RepID=A0A1G7PM06_RHOCA|nr:GIY-YIG nuclease family protein [Rhodobacter capsulatus]WER09184.1 GIY-YIG nuclease family protein [Rhodobacter capsulatus]SDF87246.1 T5orf172 domain-containing protein [Rhodobacter capsulatus]
MARYRSIEEILAEEDELGLLNVTLRPRAARTPDRERDAQLVEQVNGFFERTGRVPSPEAADHDEMRLGVIWKRLADKGPAEDLADVDRNDLLSGGHLVLTAEPPPPDRDWREEPDQGEIPASLDDIFDDDELDVPEALTTIRHVTPAEDRLVPDHRAEFYPCHDFDRFRQMFERTQAALESGEREVRPINFNEEVRVDEGSLFIRKGLLTYVAEKAEMTARAGKRDHRLRIIFSNGMESDPLLSSFRKALADDPTARAIHRHGLGAMDPDWEADRIDLTGTVYVVRSKSKDPAIAEVSGILLKIGVTTQDVRRRIADARNDPTFLLAPVELVATYDLVNLSWRKVEGLLHRFFDAARPRDLWITDRFGRKVYPREWFYVLPEHVSRAVQAIRDGNLHELEYDPESQKILKKADADP